MGFWVKSCFIAFLLININGLKAEEVQDQQQCLGDVCDGNLIVKISNGVLRGKDNGYYYSYESIPYAEPPVEKLRFENPKTYSKKWKGIFDATVSPKRCIQYDQFKQGEDKVHGFEDCLTINIYRPKYVEEALPVLLLIHGGAFMFGAPNDYDQTFFMKSGRVIVVKITYRLGPLGFLSTDDDVISGNFGLKDQQLALQWVRDSINHFGGDSDKVMVVGFSAGGASTHLQMLQSRSKDLIKVAASFSGTAFNPWVFIHKPKERALKLAEFLGCTSLESTIDIKECLQNKPAEAIVGAVKEFLIFGFNPFTTFGPVIENASVEEPFITKTPAEIIMSGEYSQIPWMASYTKDDGAYNAAELMQITADGKELIYQLNDLWLQVSPHSLFFRDLMASETEALEFAKNLKERYLGEKDFSTETYRDVQRMYTDVLFKNGIEEAIRLHSQYGKAPVYSYVYENPADQGVGNALSNRYDINFGTPHGDDFFLLFNYATRAAVLRPDEQLNSNRFIKMLEDFIYTNGELTYGSCQFVDNTGKEQLQLMFIEKDACQNKDVERFP